MCRGSSKTHHRFDEKITRRDNCGGASSTTSTHPTSLRSVDVLTAQEDGASTLPDPELLDRATALGRGLSPFDDDLLREGARRQQAGEAFAGVIYAHQLRITIGQCVHDLELIAKVEEPEGLAGQVVRIPL